MFKDPTGLCTLIEDGGARRCSAVSGDNLSYIAADYGISPNDIRAWHRIAYGNDTDVGLIHVGQTIYLEDPSIYIQNPPPAIHSGQLFNGYIEGKSGTSTLASFILYADGQEEVYDFETLQRTHFTLTGNYFLGFACGLSTNLAGVGESWYTGFFHFPASPATLQRAYAGTTMSLSVVGNAPNPFSGTPLDAFGMGAEATGFISANGTPISGIPTATDLDRIGATLSLTEGFSVGRLPFGIILMSLNYTAGETEQYYTVTKMMQDIMDGKGTALGDTAVAYPLFVTSRIFFADQLRRMYMP